MAHLVWAPLGVARLRRFVESYVQRRSGVEHGLLVVYNGFALGQDVAAWERELVDVPHQTLRLARPVLDLDAYRAVGEQVRAERYCFLNSYSVVLADRWLAVLSDALDGPGVGLVGATGSWASMRSLARFDLGLGGPYARVFDDRMAVRMRLVELAARHAAESPSARQRWMTRKLRAASRIAEQTRGFSGFPSVHVRTNGFMIGREALLRMRWDPLVRKVQAHRMESGPHSLTEQVRLAGEDVLVVSRVGRAYAPSQWWESGTFWQADQAGLMIADNQTEDYAQGDQAMRSFLSRYAWGERAQPTLVGLGVLA